MQGKVLRIQTCCHDSLRRLKKIRMQFTLFCRRTLQVLIFKSLSVETRGSLLLAFLSRLIPRGIVVEGSRVNRLMLPDFFEFLSIQTSELIFMVIIRVTTIPYQKNEYFFSVQGDTRDF